MTKLLTSNKLFIRILAALVILAVVMMLCSLIGTESISLKKVFASASQDSHSSPDYLIFTKIRLPRVILAAIVGSALACAGVIFQALLRNPLADPYILGISSGAGLGAIVAFICGSAWRVWGMTPVGVFAFAGALGTAWLVWFIGRWTGRSYVAGLLLAGVVISAFFSAIIMFLTSVSKSKEVYATIFWLMGNVAEEEFRVLWLGGGCVLFCIVALYFVSPQLNAISFGTEDAKSMGINITAVQTVSFSIAAGITAVAVSLSGLIGFVGLIVPHIVRLIFGPDHRQLLPLSAIAGAVFLVAADSIARVIVAPAQLPVGVVTAMAGAPLFLVLLVRHSKKIGWFK